MIRLWQYWFPILAFENVLSFSPCCNSCEFNRSVNLERVLLGTCELHLNVLCVPDFFPLGSWCSNHSNYFLSTVYTENFVSIVCTTLK